MFLTQVTDKIALKYPDKNDAEPLFSIIDRERDSLRTWLPWLDSTKTAEDEANFIRFSAEKMARGELWIAVILYDGNVAGTLDIHDIVKEHHRGQIGYWLSEEFRGKNIMGQSVRKLIDIAFNELGLVRLELLTDTENLKSRNVAEKAGFSEDCILKSYYFDHGEYRDAVLFSIVKEDSVR